MLNNSLDYMRDNRTAQRLQETYEKSIRNEQRAISALSTVHLTYGLEGWGDKIDKREGGQINTDPTINHYKPDWYYYLNINGKTLTATYELKCNRALIWPENEIYIKRAAIWSMVNDPDQFPNGKLLVCNPRKFALMPALQVSEYPQEVRWNKTVFVVPEEDFTFQPWLVPIEFE